jgi:hypothetical protein
MDTEKKNTELTLPEKVLLLALNDKGWFGSSEQGFKFGLAGAVIFELVRMGNLEMNGDSVLVKLRNVTNDKVLDSAMDALGRTKKKLTVKSAILRIVYKRGLKWKAVVKGLIDKGIIRKEEYHFWVFVSQNKYPIVDVDVKKNLLAEIHTKIMGTQTLSATDLMMISIMKNCRMVSKSFHFHDNFIKIRLKIRQITDFKEPLSDEARIIKIISDGMRKAILASNVSIHI